MALIFFFPLSNFEIKLDLNCSENCVILASNVTTQATTFLITDAKLYVSVQKMILK